MVLQFLKSSYEALKSALKKTRSFFADRLTALFSGKIDQEMLDGLEELFYEADLGVSISRELTGKTKDFLKNHPQAKAPEIIRFLQEELTHVLSAYNSEIQTKPLTVLLIVGVNGNGKTTAVAKLAKLFKDQGKRCSWQAPTPSVLARRSSLRSGPRASAWRSFRHTTKATLPL